MPVPTPLLRSAPTPLLRSAPRPLARSVTVAVVLAGAFLVTPAAAVPTAAPVTASAAVPAAAAADVRTATAESPLTPAEQRVRSRLTARLDHPDLGTDVKGLVIDKETGRVVWAKGPRRLRMPASTTKLATAVAVLETFGPDHRFATRVRRGATGGRIVLVGRGDPSLSSDQLSELAADAAADLRARGYQRATVVVDDSLFPAPSLAPGWLSSYVPEQVRWVRALVVDERHAHDTSLDTGHVFAAKLAAEGIKVRAVERGTAPAGAHTIAYSRGQTLAAIVQRMLLRSDNDHAEALFHLTAVGRGVRPSWARSAAEVRAVLKEVGLPLDDVTLYDGSGLSRSNRVSARSLVEFVRLSESAQRPKLAPIRAGGLPVAGRTGTLSTTLGRYDTAPTKCAAGRLTGKTGNLTGSQTLAGVAHGLDGRQRIYSFLVGGRPAALETKRAVDRLASTVTGCW